MSLHSIQKGQTINKMYSISDVDAKELKGGKEDGELQGVRRGL